MLTRSILNSCCLTLLGLAILYAILTDSTSFPTVVVQTFLHKWLYFILYWEFILTFLSLYLQIFLFLHFYLPQRVNSSLKGNFFIPEPNPYSMFKTSVFLSLISYLHCSSTGTFSSFYQLAHVFICKYSFHHQIFHIAFKLP